MRILKYSLIIVAFFSVTIAQQSVEEMMKQMQQQVDREMKKNEEAVAKYISRDDSLFAEFLKNQWKAFDAKAGAKADSLPKPMEIPVIPETKIQYEKYLPIDVDLPELEVDTKIDPEIVPRKIPVSAQKIYKGLTLSFFGKKLKFQYNPEAKISIKKPVNKKTILEYWNEMSKIETEPMIKQVEEYSQLLKLNDYGRYLLVKQISGEFLPDNDSRILFCWYVMTKMGFDVRVGYGRNFTLLMIPSDNMLYARAFLTIKGQKFFIFTLDEAKKQKFDQIYSYDKNHPDANKHFDFAIKSLPKIGKYKKEKELKFLYQKKEYRVKYNYNEEIIKFFTYYPQTEYPIYFKAPISNNILYSFVKSFKPIIEDKSEQEALNIILRFVQTAFAYKTDDDNFGREKPLIPDETFYYKYSDCEDRSILFAVLVKEMLGLKTVGLKYSGHMAIGVQAKSHPKGDYVSSGKSKYLVCDPTYINANIGQSMPKYKNASIRIINF